MDNPDNYTETISKSIYIGLFLVPILWGSTFIATKHLTQDYPIFFTTTLRHAIAFLGFFPYFSRLKHINGRIFKAGFITGAANFSAIALQTYGLKTTTSGKAGFITSLYIILIPVFLWLIFKRKIERKVIFAVIMSFCGLAILVLNPSNINSENSNQVIQKGDLLIVAAAVLFSFQLIFTERFVRVIEEISENKTDQELKNEKNTNMNSLKERKVNSKNPPIDPILFVMAQLLSITILSIICMPIAQEENVLSEVTSKSWMLFLFLGILGTTVPFFFHNWGQRYIASDKTGVIFATEPIFATIFGILIDNEPFTWQLAVGGLIIITAIYIVIKGDT